MSHSVPTSTEQPAIITIDPPPELQATLESIMHTMAGTIGVLSSLLASPDLPVTLRVAWGSQLEMRRDDLAQERDRLQRCVLQIASMDGKERER